MKNYVITEDQGCTKRETGLPKTATERGKSSAYVDVVEHTRTTELVTQNFKWRDRNLCLGLFRGEDRRVEKREKPRRSEYVIDTFPTFNESAGTPGESGGLWWNCWLRRRLELGSIVFSTELRALLEKTKSTKNYCWKTRRSHEHWSVRGEDDN